MQTAYEKIGVVDSEWIVHMVVPSLGSQVCSTPLSEHGSWISNNPNRLYQYWSHIVFFF